MIAFFKKELDCKSECSKWGTFLTSNKKRVTVSTTLTTLTLIVFKEGQNFSHRSFHIMKIDKTISFVAGSFGLRGVAKLGEGGGGRGMAEMYVAPIPPPSSSVYDGIASLIKSPPTPLRPLEFPKVVTNLRTAHCCISALH